MIPFEVFFEITQLDAEYWACADKRTETSAGDLFTVGGLLVLGTLRLEGRDAIQRFFNDRDRQNTDAVRITRHVSSPLRITEFAAAQWGARSVVLVFAGTGVLPVTSDVPSTIADVQDLYVRDESGRFLLERRLIRPTFVSGAAASFAR